MGALGGPVGAVIGGAVGAVVGGLAGKAAAEQIDPTVEDAYWRDSHKNRSDAASGESYDQYASAYRYGWESRAAHQGKRFEDVEANLGQGWDKAKGPSKLAWDKAKVATRAAWDRVARARPGDAGRDGK